jgi:two-component system sensor histidine kinase QseC
MKARRIGDGIFSGNWSVRGTMLAVLLLLTISVWSMGTLILYLEAGNESRKLFDQSLEETAHLLLVLANHEIEELAAAPPHAPMEGHDVAEGRYLLFQIWDANGTLRYKNKGAPDQPFANAGTSGFGHATIAGTTWRTYAAWNTSHRLQIQVGEPGTRRNDISGRFAWKLLLFAMLILPVMGIGIWWTVSRGLRPLLVSAEEVSRRTPNDLRPMKTDGAPVELQPLLHAINHLFERVSNTFEREQRFTADAAHELRTPLAAIKTNLQVLQGARTEVERNEFIAALGVSVDRSTRLVAQLMTLSRLDPQQQRAAVLGPVDLSGLLTAQLPELRRQADRLQLRFDAHIEPVRCLLDPDSFLILFRNVIDNAFRYTPQCGTVRLSCRVDGSEACLTVADSGPGIPAAMRERVFDRFVRLSNAGTPGSGLGLSIVRNIVLAHGASIALKDGPGGHGLLVEIRFALAREAPGVNA